MKLVVTKVEDRSHYITHLDGSSPTLSVMDLGVEVSVVFEDGEGLGSVNVGQAFVKEEQ